MKPEDFFLKKLKLDSKTVVVNYTKEGSDEEIQSTKKNIPHPDMRKFLSKLKPIVADIFDMPIDNPDNININGIVLSTMKNKIQVMVLAQYVTRTGHKVNINTHNIPYDGDDYMEQPLLEGFINNIHLEVYEYLFGRKQAQMDLEDAIEEKEKELELQVEEKPKGKKK